MKRITSLANRYKTPDEWKDRAKKIAQGKGIYAGVKTRSVWKMAVAAAVALALGVEGISLLRGSQQEVESKEYRPAPTETISDEQTERFVIKQKLKNYFPNAFDDGLDALCDDYKSRGCALICTADNGVAYTHSPVFEGTEGQQDFYALSGKYFFDAHKYYAECDGYLLDGSKLTVLLRYTPPKGGYIDGGAADDPVKQSLVPHACVYNTVSGEVIEPVSVKMFSNAGMLSYYVRVETDLGSNMPSGGFSDISADIHMYYADDLDLVKPADIKDTNDVGYGLYHFDVKVVPSLSSVTVDSTLDAYTNIKRYTFASDPSAYEMTRFYHNDNVTAELTDSVKPNDENAKRISPDRLLLTDRADKSYTDNIKLECDGSVTDGVSAMLFIRANAPAEDFLADFKNDCNVKLYLMPEGKELVLDTKDIVRHDSSDPTSLRMTVAVKPEYLLDGHKIEAHILSDTDGEKALHYVFTMSVPEDTHRFGGSPVISWDSDEGIYSTFDDAKAYTSTMGVLVRRGDEQIQKRMAAIEQSVSASGESADVIALINAPLGNTYGDTEYREYDAAAAENFAFVKYSPEDKLTAHDDRLLEIKKPDGTHYGYYFAYSEPRDMNPQAFAFYDERKALEKMGVYDALESD